MQIGYRDGTQKTIHKTKISVLRRMTPKQTRITGLYTGDFSETDKGSTYIIPRFLRKGICRKHTNRGSAAIEAMLVMPIVLFVFWAFYSMAQIYILENQIYQACLNTADYLAEYAYLDSYVDEEEHELLTYGVAMVKLREYLPEQEQLTRYIVGGRLGLAITEPIKLDEEEFFSLKVKYFVHIPIPLLRNLYLPLETKVRQKAFTGYREKEDADGNGEYVYLADYSEVYHTTRRCTHLSLSITSVSEAQLASHSDLRPCAYCGKSGASEYYITDQGECYHTSLNCSGLKRTIRRVPIEEAEGLPACSRCAK